MQVTETKNEALKREYTVVVDAKTISEQMETELKSMSGRVKIPGFRPGHIPLSVLKQRFGKSVMGDVLDRTVNQSSQRVLKDHNLRPALAPKIEITSYEEGGNLEFRMDLELMPEVKEIDFSIIELEKMVGEVEPSEIDTAIAQLADRNKSFAAQPDDAEAKKGDQVLIDFVGRMDGVAFEGGTASNFGLELGSGQFIEGFEDQLIGAKKGDEKVVKVTFPAQYHKDDLAGKPAEFTVTLHEVRAPEKKEADDEFAKKLGFDDLAALRKAVAGQFSGEYEATSRTHMKKQLFDILEAKCEFPIPQGMRDLEFANIWEKLGQAKKEGDEHIAGKSDDELKAEYGKIADRRVKLGILLSDIAARNKIQVNQDELSRAVMQQASQYPGQERKVFEFYQKNPSHLEELRGPILEEKAVDFILSKARVTERKVTRDELFNEPEEIEEAEPNRKPAKVKKAANE